MEYKDAYRINSRYGYSNETPSSCRSSGRASGLWPLSFCAFSSLALLALLHLLSVTGKDEVVVVEVGQLAIQAPVAVEFLRRREHAATLGALLEKERERGVSE